MTHPNQVEQPRTQSVEIVRAIVMGLFADMTAVEFNIFIDKAKLHKRTKARIYKVPQINEAAIMYMSEKGDLKIWLVCLDRWIAWDFSPFESDYKGFINPLAFNPF